MAYSVPTFLQNKTYGYTPAPTPAYTPKQRPAGQYSLAQKAFRFVTSPWTGQGTLSQSINQPGGAFSRPGGGGLILVGAAQQRGQTQGPVQGPTNTGGGGLIPLGQPQVGGSGGYSSSEVSAQQKAIADARQAFMNRAARYGTYFDAQSAELERQKIAEQQAVTDARASAGKSAAEGRNSLGSQNTNQQAGINKGAQASGIFDSSARIGAIQETQGAFDTALGQLNDQEKQYYGQLDKQLTDTLAQYNLQKMNMDISKADTAQEIQDKLAAFDQAERDITNQITSLRQSAVGAAQKRQTEFYTYLGKLSDTLGSMTPDAQNQAITSFSEQYGVNPDAVRQQLSFQGALRDLRGSDANAKNAARQYLISLNINPADYGG